MKNSDNDSGMLTDSDDTVIYDYGSEDDMHVDDSGIHISNEMWQKVSEGDVCFHLALLTNDRKQIEVISVSHQPHNLRKAKK